MLLVEALVAGVGVALNPPAVIAALVLAASSRNKALAFAAGWLVGLILMSCVAVLIEDALRDLGGPSVLGALVKVALGAGLLVFALVKWRKRATSSGEVEAPSWMASITGMSGSRAFLTAVAFASLNPKTLAFVVAGTLAILQGVSGPSTQVLAAVLFAVFSSLSVSAPVVLVSISPRRFEGALDSAAKWLGANGSVITAALLAVIGGMLLYSGATGLLA